jgi:tRNA(fMet)-specific endonuclease VapC
VKYILDTNAVSALMRGDETMLKRLGGVPKNEVGVPQPVIAEIEYGIERLPRSKRKDALRERFALICGELPRAAWTDEVSEAFGRIKAALERKGSRIEDFDAAIAAHALAASAVLVSANLDDMVRVPGLVVEDWSSVRRG